MAKCSCSFEVIEFVFSTGETITKCTNPLCTKGDTKRQKLLGRDTRHLHREASLVKELQAIRILEESAKAVASNHGRIKHTAALPDTDNVDDETVNDKAVSVVEDLFDKYQETDSYGEAMAIEQAVTEEY